MELKFAMEVIQAQLQQDSNTNLTLKELKNDSKNSENNSVNALQLIGRKVTSEDFFKAEEIIKLNYGFDYPKEKFTLLWDLIKEEGWTNYRLQETIKWFLKTKKYPNWTIADFFDYQVKLYSYNEYLKKLNENHNLNNEIEWYEIDGKYMWKYKDGIQLPLKKVQFKNSAKEIIKCESCGQRAKYIKQGFYICSKECWQKIEEELKEINNIYKNQ